MCYAGPILARINFRLLDAAHQNGNKKYFFLYDTVFDRGFRNNRNNLHSPFYKHWTTLLLLSRIYPLLW